MLESVFACAFHINGVSNHFHFGSVHRVGDAVAVFFHPCRDHYLRDEKEELVQLNVDSGGVYTCSIHHKRFR